MEEALNILVPILVFLAVVGIGGGVALALTRRRQAMRARLIEDDKANPSEPAGGAAVRAASRLGGAVSLGSVSTKLKEQLANAGYYRDVAAATYLGAKFLLCFGGGSALTAALLQAPIPVQFRILLIVLGAGILFFAPNMYVRMRSRQRRTAIRNHLPDAVDLLEICVSSGMGLDTAWNAVSDEVRRVCPVLADEMALVNLEVQLGVSRTDAMRNMAKRTGADDLSALVALLVQSERFGTSIAEALRTFAASMRELRSSRAEESAEKMAVKLLFPLVFFIFPVMLIVMVGPAGITLYEVMIG